MYENLLEEYKKLPDEIKSDLHILDGFNTCYMRDKNISDDMVIFITNIARECWLDDEYSDASVSSYVDFLLDGVYENGVTKEELGELYSKDIVEAYNTDGSIEDIVQFDTSNLEYCFATVDRLKYYSDSDGLYAVNNSGRCIKMPHPMENPMDEIFNLLAEDKIVYMPLSMHYNIRCMIKNDIMGDEELEEEYKVGIDKYKNECIKKNITSEDILRVVNLNNDISLTEIDGVYTKKNKMERLSNYYHNIHDDVNNYTYAASLDNSTDYYYKNGKYLALDKNNVVKEFDDKDYFLISELKDKHNFVHITDEEIYKITREIKKIYRNDNNDETNKLFNKKIDSLVKFTTYLERKEIRPFKDEVLPVAISMFKAFREIEKKDLSRKIKVSKKYKSKDNGFEK